MFCNKIKIYKVIQIQNEFALIILTRVQLEDHRKLLNTLNLALVPL